ncbi:unnamed protein product [Eruca vesicaria subsp. sativa]|uniref:Uncharacterized protein n=1 Tax=Eruca vesicaria subsp. sativa TaxID=29727 RepID=A0ABC8JWN9_ERUVS|nr:unnamed protein product [Eruca vesicaria subsp. sativa]
MILHIIELARVTPAPDSPEPANSLSIPLTFLDLPWLVFDPLKRVTFYQLNESTRDHFYSFILPKLKLSLSLVLRSYLPLTGRIIWNPNEPKPTILVTHNDAVSVTVAESDADFYFLSGYEQRPVSELHNLTPKLPVSDDSLTAYALQITLFPNNGFSIGVTANHAVLDGKTLSMFFKAWAHVCKQLHEDNKVVSSLPETLTPSLDRSLIKDQTGLDQQMIEMVRSMKKDKTNESRSLTPILSKEPEHDVVLATLLLSRDDVEKLRERVKSLLHVSTFVIAYAYVWTCLVKARGGNGERLVSFLFVGDLRERLDPPLPATYFGNCLFPVGDYNRKAVEFEGRDGLVTAVEIMSGLVRGLSSRKVETIAEEFKIGFDSLSVTSQFGSVAGSNRLGVYESDFGWGRPVKTDVVSIGKEGISMGERRDESGGVEIGVCLKKTDMDIVFTLFNNGLKN